MALSSHACWGQMLHDLPSPMAGAAPLMPTIRANQSPAQAPNVELRSDSLVSNIDVNDSSNLLIGAVKVDCAPQIEPAAFMHVVMPYIGHQLDRQQLQAMLNAISNVARGRGYVLARAAIPLCIPCYNVPRYRAGKKYSRPLKLKPPLAAHCWVKMPTMPYYDRP